MSSTFSVTEFFLFLEDFLVGVALTESVSSLEFLREDLLVETIFLGFFKNLIFSE